MFHVRQLARCDINKQVKVLAGRILKCDIRFLNAASSLGILNSGLPDLVIPKVSIDEFVFENIGKWENYTAMKCAVTGRKYTYKEIRSKANNFGAALRKKLKLGENDVVTVLLPNVPEFPIAALGIIKAGLICTTVNPIYTPDEICRQLSDCSAKVIITLTDLWPLAKATRDILKKDIPIVTINSLPTQSTPNGAINFSDFTDTRCDLDITVSSEAVAFLPYSSGTTGLPKGVQLTHYNIVSNLCQITHPDISLHEATTADHQDITPAVLPMFHIYGLTVLCMYQLRQGCQIVTLPKFTPDLFISTWRKEKPNVLYVAPPLAIFLANHPTIKPNDFDHLRTIVNSAAYLGQLDSAKLLQRAGNRNISILQGYGLTETSPTVLFNRLSFKNIEGAAGSLGKPIPNTEVKIVNIDDPKGVPLGPNELGELLVKGPQVMKGYYNRQAEDVFLDGWFRTGDMMYYNEQGFLFITDRVKELIKVKGFQVAPAELEEIIRGFPNIAEAAVIAVPHSSLGEAPRAFVVPEQGAKIDVDKLMKYVKTKVTPYKQLAGGVSIVEGIPKNATGKILRRKIKLEYLKQMEEQ